MKQKTRRQNRRASLGGKRRDDAEGSTSSRYENKADQADCKRQNRMQPISDVVCRVLARLRARMERAA